MNLVISLATEFGRFCADGEAAARFRFERVDPYVESSEQISFDFADVRNMSSSFCNALLANLVSQHGSAVLSKVRFLNCRPNVRVMVESAIQLGMERCAERGHAVS